MTMPKYGPPARLPAPSTPVANVPSRPAPDSRPIIMLCAVPLRMTLTLPVLPTQLAVAAGLAAVAGLGDQQVTARGEAELPRVVEPADDDRVLVEPGLGADRCRVDPGGGESAGGQSGDGSDPEQVRAVRDDVGAWGIS